MEDKWSLDNYKWKQRLFIIFARNPKDPIYQWQLKEINENNAGLLERDIMILKIFDEGNSIIGESSISHTVAKNLQKTFKIKKSQFTVILIGKDGEEKYWDEKPAAHEDIFSIVDSLPLRKKEMQGRSE